MVRKKNIFCPACRAENIESNDHDYVDACLCHMHTIESVDDATKTEHSFLNAITRAEKAEAVVREMLEMLRRYRDETHHKLATGCFGEMLQRLDERWLVANTLITRCEHIARRYGLEVE